MAVQYKVKVINNPNGLPLMNSPVSTSGSSGSLVNGGTYIASTIKTAMDGSVWFYMAEFNKWAIYQARGTSNMKILGEVEEPITVKNNTESAIQEAISTIIEGASRITNTPSRTSSTSNASENASTSISNTKTKNTTTYQILNRYNGKDQKQQNGDLYPTVIGQTSSGEYTYDWTMNMDSLSESIAQIKRDMNIPSAYTRNQLNLLMNNAFNRYKITYPDYLPTNLSGVAFFTRPDLNLVDDDGNYLDQVLYEPQLYYATRNNSMVLKQLTMSYSGSHEFIPILYNTCRSLDASDESVETMDTGETFSGNKMMYAKHNIKSLIAGTFNCKFIDSYDMAVTHLFQGWCTYESNVFLGTMSPKLEYIGSGQIDYACDAYLFLTDRTGCIKFFTKYYGVFPTSVGKSTFSYNDGDNIQLPEQNITFAYFAKKDLDPTTIVEFNAHSNLPLTYKTDHDNTLGHGGNTWSGPPYVELKHVNDGTPDGADQLYLRYRLNTIKV